MKPTLLGRTLAASGALFLLCIALPWTPRRFAWHVMLQASDWFERLWPPFLLCAGVVSLAAALWLAGRRRAGVAAGVGGAGYGLWFFVNTPNMVRMWDGRWQLAVFLIGVVATPVGLLRRWQAVATVGALALAAALLAPVATQGGARPFLALVLRGIGRPERLMWQETATLMWWLVLAIAAAGTLVLWVARSRALEKTLAVIVILWPAVLGVLTGVLHTVMVSGSAAVFLRLPVATLAPLILAAAGSLLTLGLLDLVGGRR